MSKTLAGTAAPLAVLLALAAPAACRAAPSWYTELDGRAGVAAATSYTTFNGDNHSYGISDYSALLSQSGTADSVARGNIAMGPIAGFQAADATSSGSVSMGAIHGRTGADTTVSDISSASTFADADFEAFWSDTVTFHTTNPLGTDYTYSVSLADSASTLVAPDSKGNYTKAFGVTDPAANAGVSAGVSVVSAMLGYNNVFDIYDSLTQAQSPDGVAPGTQSQSAPPSRTLSATIHVFDGSVVSFNGFMYMTARTYYVNAAAGVDASDTSYFNLRTDDALASYSAASGTVYATEGDPDLPITAAVPEPETCALMFAGLLAMGWKQRRTRARRADA